MAISALLKSAQATKDKIQASQDAEVAYEWQQSAQTYDDYVAYSKYLNDALSKTSDPTKQLSYTTKLSTAFSSYSSNEIQRQTQSVIEGNSTLQDKMSVVEGLYRQAVANGDSNLAQNLVSTWDSLSVQAQNEAKAAASAAKTAKSEADTALKNQVADYKDQLGKVLGAVTKGFTQATTPQEVKANIAAINAQLPANLQIPDGAGVFDVAASVASNMAGIYQQAINQAGDDATKRALQTEYNTYVNGNILELPGTNGSSIKLNMQDIQKQIAASNVGQSMFTEVKTANGTGYVANKIDNYQFGHDANGNVVAVPTYSINGNNPNTTVTDINGNPIYTTKNGKSTKNQATYTDLLKQAGFNVTNSNGSLIIQDTTGQNRLQGSDTAQAYLDQNGKLQFTNNENQIYTLAFDQNGKFAGTNKEIANPFLAQYSAEYKGNDTPYFQANQDQAQQAFGTAGLLTPQTIAQFNKDVGINQNPILKGGSIGNSSVPQFTPTGVLQGAATVQANNAAKIQAPQIVTAPVPQLQAPNLTQSILNSNQNSTIKIAKPTAPTATISTAPQKSSGKFTGVSTTVPKFNISF